jgi:hypothetical protein
VKLELCRAAEGSHFVVVLTGRDGKGIAIPLSQQVSNSIEIMLIVDGIPTAEVPQMERSG